jgi:dTDP-glucose 4,6-dehydratase
MGWDGIVLTGCAGFIGLNYLKKVLSPSFLDGWDVIILIDKMGYATTYNKKEYRRLVEKFNLLSIEKNINDIDGMNSVYNPTSPTEESIKWTVLDFASESHVDNSIRDPDSVYQENASLPSNLIKWLGGVKKIKNYIHISTDEVYGDISFENRGKQFFKTTDQYKPSNPYSASKVAQDAYLHALHKTYGMPLTIIRMANQFGPWQHPEKMLPASILRALRGEKIKIYGEGKNCRQWTFVESTVGLIIQVVDSIVNIRNTEYNVVHLADKNNLIDNNELIAKLEKLLKTKYGINPSYEYIEDRKGHDAVYALETESFVDKQYNYTFDYTLEKTVDYYVERFNNGDYN